MSKAITELPDLILTDSNLPDMITLEAITILKQIPVTSSISIVVLTAETARRWKIKGTQTGAAEYILKRIPAHDLLSVCVDSAVPPVE
jgi:CheY-like chemotaxis protein